MRPEALELDRAGPPVTHEDHMDPDACLDRLLRAVNSADTDELRSAANDLADWIDKGGFVPDGSIYLPDLEDSAP